MATLAMPLADLPESIPPGLCARFTGRVDAIGISEGNLMLIDWKKGGIASDDVLVNLPSSMIFTCLAERDFLRRHAELRLDDIEIVQVSLETGDASIVVLDNDQRTASTDVVRDIIIAGDQNQYPENRNVYCHTCELSQTCTTYLGEIDSEAL